MTVVWQSVVGEVLGYKIRYKKAGSGQYKYIELLGGWESQHQGKVTNLEENTSYEIQVAGYTEDGIGPYSDRIMERTKNGEIYKFLILCSLLIIVVTPLLCSLFFFFNLCLVILCCEIAKYEWVAKRWISASLEKETEE